MVWCGRISEGSLHENAGGQFLHRLAEDWRRAISISPAPATSRVGKNFTAEAERWFSIPSAEEARSTLARRLGVSSFALEQLRVGWNPNRGWWTIPERDSAGRIIGLATRTETGIKKRRAGGRAGLTYADDWHRYPGPIFLVEGASDSAALITMELCAVGRPSNRGGVDQLIGLFKNVSPDREIVVIGEWDEKADGRWPGREGAISTAAQLAEALARPIGWALPPDDAKDSRSWLNSVSIMLPRDRKADLFRTGLSVTWVQPVPRTFPSVPAGPSVALSDWREQMFQARLSSLQTSGAFVDLSTTGCGKSHLDLMVLLNVAAREAA